MRFASKLICSGMLFLCPALADATFGPALWALPNCVVLRVTSVDQQSGALAGSFAPAVVSQGCTGANLAHPIVGWFDPVHQVITFSVHYAENGCNSVVTWYGHFDPSSRHIVTLWARAAGDKGMAVTTGAADFSPR